MAPNVECDCVSSIYGHSGVVQLIWERGVNVSGDGGEVKRLVNVVGLNGRAG